MTAKSYTTAVSSHLWIAENIYNLLNLKYKSGMLYKINFCLTSKYLLTLWDSEESLPLTFIVATNLVQCVISLNFHCLWEDKSEYAFILLV